jgi:signal transduction histidine kinase
VSPSGGKRNAEQRERHVVDLAAGLQLVQVLVFLGAGAAAFRLWFRNRTRPAALSAAAFGTIGVVLLVGRLFPADGAGADVPLVRDLVVVGLAMFPWLLALFAWSFEPRIPRWLLSAGAAVLLLGVWVLWLPPSALGGASRSPAGTMFVGAFVAVWVVLATASAVRLWRAGGTQPVVRARMRLLSLGVVVLTAALLLAGAVPAAQGSALRLVAVSLSIVSALMFVAGFAPPRPLRAWWRGRATGAWQELQLDLLSASSPQQAAGAVVPVVSDLLGGGAAIVTDSGQVLAVAGMTEQEAHDAAMRIGEGGAPPTDDEVVELESAAMIVRPTSYTPLFGQDERDLVSGFAGQLRLALDRVQLHELGERTARELQRARDEEQAMIMGLAHDLRGSSNTLGGFTMLLRSSRDDAEREEILSGIEASSSHLEALVGSLLELGRVGASRPRTGAVDLGEVVDEVIARLEPGHPGLRFHRAALPVVAGDRLELVQVFDNLFTNAARHGGPEVSTITVTSEQGPDTVTIEVCDDGRGVDAGDRASIFRLFQRGRSAGGAGSGVGLNLTRRIVEAHGGTIELLDNDPGARFRLCLPATAGAEDER